MGHLSALFGDWLPDNIYFRRLDADPRTVSLLKHLRLRGYDDALLEYLLGEAITIPARWETLKAERASDREARRHKLASQLQSLAEELRNDPDITRLTVLDVQVWVEAYACASDLATIAAAGIPSDPLVDVGDDLIVGRATSTRHVRTIKGRFGREEKYAVLTLSEYLVGVAACLQRADWPDRFDAINRERIPRKKEAVTAMRTFVMRSVLDVMTRVIDTGARRAPNNEAATLTNILLNLAGAEALTANAVSVAKQAERLAADIQPLPTNPLAKWKSTK